MCKNTLTIIQLHCIFDNILGIDQELKQLDNLTVLYPDGFYYLSLSVELEQRNFVNQDILVDLLYVCIGKTNGFFFQVN